MTDLPIIIREADEHDLPDVLQLYALSLIHI